MNKIRLLQLIKIHLLQLIKIRLLQLIKIKNVYLQVIADQHHLLHGEIIRIKGTRFKRVRSWMYQDEDVLQEICSREEFERDEEWTQALKEFETFLGVTLNIDCDF
jgi:hypothetical protein